MPPKWQNLIFEEKKKTKQNSYPFASVGQTYPPRQHISGPIMLPSAASLALFCLCCIVSCTVQSPPSASSRSLSAIADAGEISKQFAASVWNGSYLSLPLESGFYYKALHYSVSQRDWSLWISALFPHSPWSPARPAGCCLCTDLTWCTERWSSVQDCTYSQSNMKEEHQHLKKRSIPIGILCFQRGREGVFSFF